MILTLVLELEKAFSSTFFANSSGLFAFPVALVEMTCLIEAALRDIYKSKNSKI